MSATTSTTAPERSANWWSARGARTWCSKLRRTERLDREVGCSVDESGPHHGDDSLSGERNRSLSARRAGRQIDRHSWLRSRYRAVPSRHRSRELRSETTTAPESAGPRVSRGSTAPICWSRPSRICESSFRGSSCSSLAREARRVLFVGASLNGTSRKRSTFSVA